MLNWIDDTVRLTKDHYNSIKEEYFLYYENEKSVLGFGTYGSIKAPGLSDLDLFVVLKDNLKYQFKPRLLIKSATEDYILIHNPMVIPSQLFEKLPYYHLVDLNWEKGTNELMFSQVESNNKIVALQVLKKTVYVQSVLWGLIIYETKVRRSFMALTSLVRSIEWLKSVDFKLTEIQLKFSRDILELRKLWSQENLQEIDLYWELERKIREGLHISFDVISSISGFILDQEPTNGLKSKKRRILYSSPFNYILESSSIGECIDCLAGRKTSYVYRLSSKLNKYGFLIGGNVSIVDSNTFNILACRLEQAVDYTKKYGFGVLGLTKPEYPIEDDILDLLKKDMMVNLDFAETLERWKLESCYMGDLWSGRTQKYAIVSRLGKIHKILRAIW